MGLCHLGAGLLLPLPLRRLEGPGRASLAPSLHPRPPPPPLRSPAPPVLAGWRGACHGGRGVAGRAPGSAATRGHGLMAPRHRRSPRCPSPLL